MNTCHISPREHEVLNLIAHEHSTKQIAQQLFISEHTVISHRKNLMTKMGVSNAPGMVRRAFEVGLMPMKILACLFFLFSTCITSIAQSTSVDSEFLYAVVEFSKDKSGTINAEVLGHGVVEGRVKKPTESKIEKSLTKSDVVIEISDSNGQLTDRVVISDPLTVPIRIPSSAGCNTIVTHPESFPVMIRRPLSKEAAVMTIRRNDNRKSAPITQLKIR